MRGDGIEAATNCTALPGRHMCRMIGKRACPGP